MLLSRSIRDYTNSDALISPVLAHVRLSKDDGDGNENGKKAIGSDRQKNNFARASRFFMHFLAVVARLRRKISYFHVLWRTGTQTTTLFLFSGTLIQSFKIQLLKNSPTFDELNKMEQARLSLKQREHTFKLTFSEPSPSLLLKLPNNPRR